MDARIWRGWLEMARSYESVERVVSRARDSELELLAEAVGLEVHDEELPALRATIDGLRQAISCRTVRYRSSARRGFSCGTTRSGCPRGPDPGVLRPGR